ncbi:hypothetical protein Pryu01_01777 [Paraliobacillus ryukyuensis]|uniref:Ribosomal protein S18 acetylase RimI-like enzyme n=1 Tax=Paraliobacillus ryukyuensis TaxID=200904 RepID=A0A366EA12_9BACI|nr:GNAT family N-acetyltransferase [Paraliobacillus ryukyuensis]RBO98294.1 ribosomal protein S18 acetylase RimI-like enzyme [Paraliobacillus ryukyuensis]
MKIRQTHDYHLIAQLNKTVHDLHHRLYPALFKPYNYNSVKNYIKEMINYSQFTFLIISNDYSEPVGYAWIEYREYPTDDFRYGYRSVFVRQLSIEEKAQHKGYGTALLNEIDNLAKVYQADQIELDYWYSNTQATQFYQKQAFQNQRIYVYKSLQK